MFFKKTDVKLIFIFIVGAVLVISAFATSVFAENDQKIKDGIIIAINQTNLVKKPYVLLKDIANVQTNEFLREALSEIEIGRSPKPGEIKVFDKNRILSIIQHQRYLPENIVYKSPQQIYVKRESQRISKQVIRQFVDKYLSKKFKGRDYELKTLQIRGLEQYPGGEVKLQFDSSEIVNNNGKLSAYIKVFIDGKKEDRLNISGRVALYENVFFAQNSLARGEMISRDCVYPKKKNIYNLAGGCIKTFNELDGKIVKSSIRKGDLLEKQNLAEPPLIKKGDVIRLVVKNNNLLIVASGISMENGFENELIKVENIGSGKLVMGRVIEASKVEVVY